MPATPSPSSLRASRPPIAARLRLLRRVLDTPESALDELGGYGPVCNLGIGPMRIVVVSSPALIRELLAMSNDRFRYDVPISPFPTVVGATSMLVSDGDEHRRRRGAVAGALSRRRVARWIPMILDCTDACIDDVLAATQPAGPRFERRLDLYPIGRRLVLDVVIRALFGERLAADLGELDRQLASGQRFLASPLWRQLPHPLPFGRRRAARRARNALDAVIDIAITAARASPPEADDGDLLDALVRSGDLTDTEIRDQVKTLIGAGFDTTASTLAWMLWESTLSPGLWNRLRAEADEVLGGDDRRLPIDDSVVGRLVLANATMRETLRIHPASGVGARTTVDAIELGGWRIPKRTIVMWSPYAAGRDPAYWSEPAVFRPDRFSAPSSPDQSRLMNEAWLPFGRGQRSCVGMALAQIELTLILARLAQRLDLTATQPHPPAARGLIVSVPDTGTPLIVAPRADGARHCPLNT